ncbi:hypothetical protein [Methylophaga sp.]|uniref:hypothetical protein n=1 Tax=Methylophaga sp. TaxID=2024840 RepID=UPI003F69C8D3
MVRVLFTHLYVIVMAIFVIMTANILSDRYGDDIVSGLNSLISSADNEINDVQNSVKDWNKNMLD